MKNEVPVLVVEDGDTEYEGLAALLEAGHLMPHVPSIRPHRAISAEVALKRLCTMPGDELPNLCIVDVELPGMNGWEFICQMRLIDRLHRIPVAMYTTHYQDRLFPDLAVQHGVVGVIEKPIADNKRVCRELERVLWDWALLPRDPVLIIDPDKSAAKRARAYLEQCGYAVRTVDSLDSASRLIAEGADRFSCVILDAQALAKWSVPVSFDHAANTAEALTVLMGTGPEHATIARERQWAYFYKSLTSKVGWEPLHHFIMRAAREDRRQRAD